MQVPSPSNNPALPSSPSQQKGTHGTGHSLGKGAGDCSSCTKPGGSCRRNSLSSRSGCSAWEAALFSAAPITARDLNPLHTAPSPTPQPHEGCCRTPSSWLCWVGAKIWGTVKPRDPPANWPGLHQVTLEGGQADLGDSSTSQAPVQAPISHRKLNRQQGAPHSFGKASRAHEVTNNALSHNGNTL